MAKTTAWEDLKSTVGDFLKEVWNKITPRFAPKFTTPETGGGSETPLVTRRNFFRRYWWVIGSIILGLIGAWLVISYYPASEVIRPEIVGPIQIGPQAGQSQAQETPSGYAAYVSVILLVIFIGVMINYIRKYENKKIDGDKKSVLPATQQESWFKKLWHQERAKRFAIVFWTLVGLNIILGMASSTWYKWIVGNYPWQWAVIHVAAFIITDLVAANTSQSKKLAKVLTTILVVGIILSLLEIEPPEGKLISSLENLQARISSRITGRGSLFADNRLQVVPGSGGGLVFQNIQTVKQNFPADSVAAIDKHFPEPELNLLFTKIAFCESSGQQFNSKRQALPNPEVENVIGLFQINMNTWRETAEREKYYPAESADENARFARYIFNTNGTKDWETDSRSAECWKTGSGEEVAVAQIRLSYGQRILPDDGTASEILYWYQIPDSETGRVCLDWFEQFGRDDETEVQSSSIGWTQNLKDKKVPIPYSTALQWRVRPDVKDKKGYVILLRTFPRNPDGSCLIR